MISRRQFLAGLMALPAAPLIASAERLLPTPKNYLGLDLSTGEDACVITRTTVLCDGTAEFEAVWTRREAEFLEYRHFARQEIAAVFRVPLGMLPELGPCQANAEQFYKSQF